MASLGVTTAGCGSDNLPRALGFKTYPKHLFASEPAFKILASKILYLLKYFTSGVPCLPCVL